MRPGTAIATGYTARSSPSTAACLWGGPTATSRSWSPSPTPTSPAMPAPTAWTSCSPLPTELPSWTTRSGYWQQAATSIRQVWDVKVVEKHALPGPTIPRISDGLLARPAPPRAARPLRGTLPKVSGMGRSYDCPAKHRIPDEQQQSHCDAHESDNGRQSADHGGGQRLGPSNKCKRGRGCNLVSGHRIVHKCELRNLVRRRHDLVEYWRNDFPRH